MGAAPSRRGPGRPPIGPRFELKLPAEMISALDREAERLHASRAEVVRMAIATYCHLLPHDDGGERLTKHDTGIVYEHDTESDTESDRREVNDDG